MIHLRVVSPPDVTGFALAVIGTLLLTLLVRGTGHEPRAYALGIRPVSNLIDTPNWFSFIVALLAASDTGVSLAFGNTSEVWGSFLQLLLNVAVLTAVAVAGLPVQRAIWQRAARRGAKNRRLMA